ncbi:MAG: exodeoxyribonuclease VII large subunit [Clostridiales bacterium]|nr:exodeoxyribonuclease VII large subunit [Clostridiales bacterium]
MVVYTVSQLNKYISFKIKEDEKLKGIIIKGEISNFTHHLRSGHFYFTLKDNESSIKAVMFKSFASTVKFMPEDGMSVIVLASVSVYERDGIYQLYVTDIQPDGVGKLYTAFEQLKDKLLKLGMFDESHKLPLPSYPKKIGVVTSKTGAALQDIINVLSRRYPIGEVVVFPAIVQGETAPQSISDAITKAQDSDCNVLIVARGGGSLEDLNAFNTEIVAYAVYNSRIPIISAVGHETDYTIADFVADMRAPTPSAAAEIAVPDIEQIILNLEFYRKRMLSALTKVLNMKYNRVAELTSKLQSYSLEYKLNIYEEKLAALDKRLASAMERKYILCESIFNRKITELDGLNPLKILSRGYSVVYKDKNLIYSSEQLQENDIIRVNLGKGKFTARVINVEE